MEIDKLADSFKNPKVLFIDCNIQYGRLSASLVYIRMGIVNPVIRVYEPNKTTANSFGIEITLPDACLRLKQDIADVMRNSLPYRPILKMSKEDSRRFR